MKSKLGKVFLAIGAMVAVFTALAHLSCIVLGPSCYQALLAPSLFVQSAIDGTWIAPVGAVVVSVLFFLCAAFALSRAGFIRQLPLVRAATLTIAIVCIIRGLGDFQLKYRYPERLDAYTLGIGVVWFATGLLFWFGHKCAPRVEN